MSSFLEKINNLKLNSQLNNKKESFSFLFFDKFKNLLDDYIVNYRIKYLFFFFFISFFLLEISFSFFGFINLPNNGIFYLTSNIMTSFIVDLLNYLNSFFIFELLYSFFSFNVESMIFLVDAIYINSFYSLPFLMVVVIFSALFFFYSNLNISIITILVYYLVYSFVFFLLYSIGFLSISLYVLFTFLSLFLFYLYSSEKNTNVDLLLLFVLFVISFLFYNTIGILLLSILTFYWIISEKKNFFDASVNNFKDVSIIANSVFYYIFSLILFRILSFLGLSIHFAVVIVVLYAIYAVYSYINYFFIKK